MQTALQMGGGQYLAKEVVVEVRHERQLGSGADEVLLQEDCVAGIDLRRLDATGEELVGVAHEVLVEGAVKGDVHREARLLAPPCTQAPRAIGPPALLCALGTVEHARVQGVHAYLSINALEDHMEPEVQPCGQTQW